MTTGIRPPVNQIPQTYKGGAVVTPHDTNELPIYAKALWIGGTTGAVKVTTIDGSVLTFPAVPAGTILPVECKIVWSTGTVATTITAVW